jgi:hypothetical protein
MFFSFSHDQYIRRLEISMDNPVTMEIVETIEQLPEQRFDCVGIYGEVKLLSVMPDNLIEIVLGVIEGEVEGHVGVVDVNIDELDNILVVDLTQKLQEEKTSD